MKVFGRAARTAAATAGAAVLVTAAATIPAQAAQGFSLDTPQSNIHDGSTHARGSISYTGQRSFRISSTVWDSCPGDGRGAYLSYYVQFKDGTGWGYPYSDAFNKDNNGCDNGKISNTITRTFSKRVKFVQLSLWEVDYGSTVYQDDFSAYKYNPYTT